GIAGELHADGLRGTVDVEHLAVDSDADDDIPVGRGRPELTAVHASGIGTAGRGRGEDLGRVRGSGEDVLDPGRGEDAFAVRGCAASGDHLTEAGQVAQGGADGTIGDRSAPPVLAHLGRVSGADPRPDVFAGDDG